MKRFASDPTAHSESIWAVSVKLPAHRRLSRDIQCDVCVVGGGIVGLTTAYMLASNGQDVVVLEDGKLASGMSQVTSAHLTNAIDDRFANIEKWHGDRGARLAAASHTAAIDAIEMIADDLDIDCDFRRVDGYLFLAPGDNESVLEEELAASHAAGLTDAEMLSRAPLDYNTGPCIRYPDQARFHPLKYLDGLARTFHDLGGHVFTNSHADHIEGGNKATVAVGSHTVTAEAVVVATNTPINDLVAIHTKQAPYMTYVIAARVPSGSVTDALYWDTLKAYHYLRLQPGDATGDLLIVGGEDHKTGQADDTQLRHARLEAWSRARFPNLGEVEFKWSGQCMETIDGLAFIGRNPLDKDNVFIATGDSGMGLTHGTIAGILLTDLILGRENSWAELYDPNRKSILAGDTFLKEQANVVLQYTDWLTPGEVKSRDEIAADSGAVMRRGMSKIAVYRDAHGRLHTMSAVCPHLDCIVHWNQAEKSWDCPCHGSRFDCHGKVINGPANSDLSPRPIDEAS